MPNLQPKLSDPFIPTACLKQLAWGRSHLSFRRFTSPHNGFINIFTLLLEGRTFWKLGNFGNSHNRAFEVNYFRLFLLQTHYKFPVLKIFPDINKKIYPSSLHFTTHIREHSTVKVPRDKMRDKLPNCFCKITKV